MPDPLSRLLDGLPDGRDWLLADGATGTALIDAGLPPTAAPELWNLTNPDAVRAHHAAMIAAGADVFLTNSFGANASRLRLAGAADRVAEINEAAARLAVEAAEAAPRPVLPVGAIGPTGEIMAPIGTMSRARAVEMFTAQAAALKAGGITMLWAETFAAPDEIRAVAEAARAVDLPWIVTMSFDTAGRSMMGTSPAQFVGLAESLRNPPVALGANCGTGASELLHALAALSAAGSERPLIAKANAGVPHLRAGRICYDGTPEAMADYAQLARDLGARIIGGCCGTSPAHLAAMHERLTSTSRGPRPRPESIAARLGEA